MNIENELQKIGNYFKQKVIDGDYVFISCNTCIATIIIDEKYHFELWIANLPEKNFEFHDTLSFLHGRLDHLKFNSDKERVAAWSKIKSYVQNYKKYELKKELEKEIDKLNKELR